MQIQKIMIKSVLGIEDFELFPGRINKVSGKNGRGKTSFIEALKTALGGGNGAELIHNGSDEGEIVLIFDNNMHLKRRIRGPKQGIMELHDSNGRPVSAPQQELNKLYDAISVNPIEFINVKDKERVELLLEALPVELNLNEVLSLIISEAELMGLPLDERDELQDIYDKSYTNALEFIDDLIKELSEERKYTKRSLDEAKATIRPLTESIVELDVDEIKTKAEIVTIIKNLEGAAKQYEDKVKQIDIAFQDEVERLRTIKENEINEIRGRYDNYKLQENNKKVQLQTNLDSVAGLLKTKEELERQKAKAEKLELDWQSNQDSITNLRDYKTTLLQSIPIEGLELTDGVISRNGVQYSKLNKAQQLEIAIEVAKLRTKDIGIICVDGIEILDSESQEVLFRKFEESGLQFFLTEVTEDEKLTITKEG
jgi:DNA repair exonuclease SbcCD ATPase subunit